MAEIRNLDGHLLAGMSVLEVVAIGDVRIRDAGVALLEDRHAERARTDGPLSCGRPNIVEARTNSSRIAKAQWTKVYQS